MSGIYIPGISMPTNCSECAFCGYYGNGEHMCDIIQKAVEYESAKMSRLDDCPLVPVPPHGRLIDADAFANEVINSFMDCAGLFEDANSLAKAAEIVDAFVADINEAPTIIPADHIGGVNEMVADKEGE